jgi:hypothetical protein
MPRYRALVNPSPYLASTERRLESRGNNHVLWLGVPIFSSMCASWAVGVEKHDSEVGELGALWGKIVMDPNTQINIGAGRDFIRIKLCIKPFSSISSTNM